MTSTINDEVCTLLTLKLYKLGLLKCRSEILGSSVDGTVRRFDVRMGCMDVDQLGAPVTAMALSHDGNCVLASCLDARMRLLDKASGQLLAQYSGTDLSFLDYMLTTQRPDACLDAYMHLLDKASGELLAEYADVGTLRRASWATMTHTLLLMFSFDMSVGSGCACKPSTMGSSLL